MVQTYLTRRRSGGRHMTRWRDFISDLGMARCSYGNVGGGGWEEWGLDIAAAQTTWTRLGRISCSVGNVRRDSIALKWGESKKRHGLISCVGFVPRTPRLTLWYDVITLRCIVLVLLTHHHTAHQTLTMSLTAMFLFFVFVFFFLHFLFPEWTLAIFFPCHRTNNIVIDQD